MKNRTSGRIAATLGLLLLSLSGCGGGGSGSGFNHGSLSLNLDFIRNTAPADGSFKAVLWVTDGGGNVVPFATAPMVTSTRGAVSALTVRGDNKQEATIVPDAAGSGEYRVTASAVVSGSNNSVSRTALVMGQVAAGWDQPVVVEGLVNTGGTQDSLAVSPDGQYLFLHYYPITISCLLTVPINSGSAFCQTPLGPVVSPQRPQMPGAGRVGMNSIAHNCPSLNFFPPSTIAVPPIALYGFRRQSDGSYAEPFVFAFTGEDGCFAPFGPTLRANGDGTYRMFVAFHDPRDSGSANDFSHLYDFNFTPGATQLLGNMSLNMFGQIQIVGFVLNQASIAGTDGHRGNPHVHYNGSSPLLLFYDDETQPAADQFIHVASWNGSAWDAATALDFAPFNLSGNGVTQPYFDGTRLIVREGLQLLEFPYNGGALDAPASWGAPTILLAPQTVGVTTGSVIVIGEPTIATIEGTDVLFFIYGLQQADGSINLRAGSVRRAS